MFKIKASGREEEGTVVMSEQRRHGSHTGDTKRWSREGN